MFIIILYSIPAGPDDEDAASDDDEVIVVEPHAHVELQISDDEQARIDCSFWYIVYRSF